MSMYKWNRETDQIERADRVIGEGSYEEWFERDRRVARDPIKVQGVPRFDVSTVFLALDHSFGRGDPVLWETIVFGANDVMWRYRSPNEARKNHLRLVHLGEFCLGRSPQVSAKSFVKLLESL